MYKLFSIDLDGTLLNNANEISYKDIAAIKYAKEKGCIICINTGRDFKSCIDYCKKVDADFVIYCHGCFIKDLRKNKFIRNRIFGHIWYFIYNIFTFRFIANKYYGLKRLCKHLSIKLKETVSIGNQITDLEMIIKSGLGICIINSGWALKYNSNYITKCDNNNSAVSDAIHYTLD